MNESAKQTKVAELKAEASTHFQAAQDSFERSDTDGFLSQWASGISGNVARLQAEIVENDGMAEFWGLFDLQGNRVNAKMIDGKFGTCWAFMDASGKFTGKFVPFCNAAADVFRYEGELALEMGDNCLDQIDFLKKEIKKATKRNETWQKKHGFKQLREMAPAMAYIAGSGKGLSGSAWAAVKRTDGK